MFKKNDNEIVPIEKQFNLRNISREIVITKKITEKCFSKKIKLIVDIIDNETKLTGHYFKDYEIKDKMALTLKENSILIFSLLNQPYISLSILNLIKTGLDCSREKIH